MREKFLCFSYRPFFSLHHHHQHQQSNGKVGNWDNQDSHDYHEISDDEATQNDQVFDFGPSLLDEMDLMFRSMTTSSDSAAMNGPPPTPNFDNVNKKNELAELSSKHGRVNGGGE